MDKNKIKILIIGLSAVLIAAVMGCGYTLAVENPKLYISPSSLTKNVGETFEFSINIDPSGQKVCAVEGELFLNNLSCQNIEVEDGIMSQTSPSCNNPYFLLGIPTCTTSEKTLFTIMVKGEEAGSASVGFDKVDIIGEGVSISSSFSQADYNIEVPASLCECDVWSSWTSQGCGQGNCSANEQLQIRTRACLPSGCEAEAETRCIKDSSCSTVNGTTISEEETAVGEEEENEGEPATFSEGLVVPGMEASDIAEKGFLANLTDALARNSLAFKIVALIILIVVSAYILFKKDGSSLPKKRS